MENYLLPINEREEPIEFADQQLKVFWTADEINVAKDIQDVLVNFTESEKHAVITTLKLFSIYETHAGSEYWGGRFKKMFNGAEFHRMASVFSMVELAIHAPFYNKINQLLHIDTPEFYMSYLDDPILKSRVEHIGEIIDHPDDLISLAAFSMVEGVILYSSFAFLKHYQSQGKNKLMNVVRGINMSCRDEHLHSIGGAWAFKYKLSLEDHSEEELAELENKVREAGRKIYEHECKIISMLFEKGTIPGITAHQLECFVQSRVNECLKELGYEKEYDVKYNPIAETFYDGINKYQFNDFFSGVGREYNRNWDQSEFKWKAINE
jgi:ribonucleotide reductase beta subunit family protein with ferritin-like domain